MGCATLQQSLTFLALIRALDKRTMNVEPRHPLEKLGAVVAGVTFLGLGGCHNPDWEVSPWIHVPLRILMVGGFLFVVFIGIMAYLNSK